MSNPFMTATADAVSLWGFPRVAMLFLVVRESSSFSIFQNNRLHQSSSIFSAPADELDWKPVTSSSGDELFPGSLFEAAAVASTPKSAETETGAHDAFRYEWGRWVDDDAVQGLTDELNEFELLLGDKIYDRLLELPAPTSVSPSDEDESTDDEKDVSENTARRFRISGGHNWDCILHVLPKGMEWRGRWPTGSWAMVRPLTGMVEMNLMRGPDRDGFYKKATTAKLRGGGDGTLGGGGGGRGEDCVKYVGGALRSYSGVGGKTMVLEVAIRPPMGKAGIDGDGLASLDIEAFPTDDATIQEIAEEIVVLEKEIAAANESDSDSEQEVLQPEEENEESSENLGSKMGLVFDKVGGLDDQLNDIVRRVLASR